MTKTRIVNATVVTGFAKLDKCGVLLNEDGTIGEIFNMKRYVTEPGTRVFDAHGCYLTPGLIDTHIHGFGGYGTDDKNVDSILGMSESLIRNGVTSFIPTLYPDFPQEFYKAQNAISKAMGNEKGARILGMHLEGPFINPKRCGALPLNAISEVNLDYFEKLIENGRGNVICMTVAPELKHMRTLALRARALNVILLAGHTDATYENIIEGMQCGILHSTHFFNAMSRLHHRNPGAVGAILIQNEMNCEIIADGVHVHPELVKLLIKEKPSDNIVLVTDSLKPTQQPEGTLIANGQQVTLSPEGAFVSADNPELLCGSALTLNKAVQNITKWDTSVDIAVKMATENPARIYHLTEIGQILPGKLADLVIFDQSFKALRVFKAGEQIFCNE